MANMSRGAMADCGALAGLVHGAVMCLDHGPMVMEQWWTWIGLDCGATAGHGRLLLQIDLSPLFLYKVDINYIKCLHPSIVEGHTPVPRPAGCTNESSWYTAASPLEMLEGDQGLG